MFKSSFGRSLSFETINEAINESDLSMESFDFKETYDSDDSVESLLRQAVSVRRADSQFNLSKRRQKDDPMHPDYLYEIQRQVKDTYEFSDGVRASAIRNAFLFCSKEETAKHLDILRMPYVMCDLSAAAVQVAVMCGTPSIKELPLMVRDAFMEAMQLWQNHCARVLIKTPENLDREATAYHLLITLLCGHVLFMAVRQSNGYLMDATTQTLSLMMTFADEGQNEGSATEWTVEILPTQFRAREYVLNIVAEKLSRPSFNDIIVILERYTRDKDAVPKLLLEDHEDMERVLHPITHQNLTLSTREGWTEFLAAPWRAPLGGDLHEIAREKVDIESVPILMEDTFTLSDLQNTCGLESDYTGRMATEVKSRYPKPRNLDMRHLPLCAVSGMQDIGSAKNEDRFILARFLSDVAEYDIEDLSDFFYEKMQVADPQKAEERHKHVVSAVQTRNRVVQEKKREGYPPIATPWCTNLKEVADANRQTFHCPYTHDSEARLIELMDKQGAVSTQNENGKKILNAYRQGDSSAACLAHLHALNEIWDVPQHKKKQTPIKGPVLFTFSSIQHSASM